ncbi:MAG: hypothetical protein NUW37_01150 [Planctomycetes bacterium]|nr:hypothetical protein [Planctomycetota bacterium]
MKSISRLFKAALGIICIATLASCAEGKRISYYDESRDEWEQLLGGNYETGFSENYFKDLNLFLRDKNAGVDPTKEIVPLR